MGRLFFLPVMKTVVFARHAKSDWSLELPDRQRPLNSRGNRDAPMMGRMLKAYGFEPDLVLSSPAVRARTTAELVQEAMGYQGEFQIHEEIYEHGAGTVASLLQDLSDDYETVMVFGHNPTTEELISYFLQMRGRVTVPTAGMACIEFPGNYWRELSPLYTHLRWFLIPKLIKDFKG